MILFCSEMYLWKWHCHFSTSKMHLLAISLKMSSLFFTKRVYDHDEYPILFGVDTEVLARNAGIFTGNSGRDLPFILYRFFTREIYPALRDYHVWQLLGWIRIMCDKDDHGRARLWCYGRAKNYWDSTIYYLHTIFNTNFVSENRRAHLSVFNAEWATTSTFPTNTVGWKVEKLRDIDQYNKDVYEYVISDDYEQF